MNADKAHFLQHQFVKLLRDLPSDTKPAWGKMTLQQMVEHFTDTMRVASGRQVHTTIVTPEEHLPKMQDFIRSDKPFRENTKNPLLPEIPAPVRNATLRKALDELQDELDYFFEVFRANEQLTTINPIFGHLNYELNVLLLYKHAVHHLRQFGVAVTAS